MPTVRRDVEGRNGSEARGWAFLRGPCLVKLAAQALAVRRLEKSASHAGSLVSAARFPRGLLETVVQLAKRLSQVDGRGQKSM